MRERWRPVVGYEGWYEVSDHGRVKRVRGGYRNAVAGRILKFDPTSRYARVVLVRNGKRRRTTAHQLVAAAFIGPCPEGHEVNHKDGNKKRNYARNLEYLTQADNNRHRCRVLGHIRGEDNPASRFTANDIRHMRKLAQRGESYSAVGRRFDTAHSVVRNIVLGRAWSHV